MVRNEARAVERGQMFALDCSSIASELSTEQQYEAKVKLELKVGVDELESTEKFGRCDSTDEAQQSSHHPAMTNFTTNFTDNNNNNNIYNNNHLATHTSTTIYNKTHCVKTVISACQQT